MLAFVNDVLGCPLRTQLSWKGAFENYANVFCQHPLLLSVN